MSMNCNGFLFHDKMFHFSAIIYAKNFVYLFTWSEKTSLMQGMHYTEKLAFNHWDFDAFVR